MSKKKRTILIIAIAVVIIIAAGAFGYAKYDEAHPVRFNSMGSKGEDLYLEIISASLKNNLKGEGAEKFKEYAQKNEEIYTEYYDKVKNGEYVKPTNIHASIEVKDGQTIFTYYGTATLASGETIQYNRQFTIDYVFTRDIPEVFKVPEK
ncbi:MAG: hypothetical protein GX051_08025 [Clostridiales bacterium]|nr:hypothetical protein [Clostridiales bacterium]